METDVNYGNWLGTISENACIGDYYQCAKFHACTEKCTIHMKFRAMPLD